MTDRRAKLLRDVIGLSGVVSLGWGLWLLKPAFAYIVVGVVLLSLAIYGATRPTEPPE